MGDSTAECQKCRSEISTAAERCPECGYEPASDGARGRRWAMLIGGLLTMTVVGAIVGVPLILFAYYAGKKAEGRTPTSYSPS